jgi:hypothetical protein
MCSKDDKSLGIDVENIQSPESKRMEELSEKQEAFRIKFEKARTDGVFLDRECDEAKPNTVIDRFEEECRKKIEILEEYERQKRERN